MLEEGIYVIHCVEGNRGLLVPPGAPIMSPVQCTSHAQASDVHVRRVGNGYVLRPMQAPPVPGGIVLGAHDNADPAMVILAPSGVESMYTEWAIEHNGTDSDGNDQYEIHTTSGPGNQYWTSVGEGMPIELQGSEGKESQQWVLKKIE